MLGFNFFKLRKNNRFNYTPRFYNGKEIENNYSLDSRFSKYKQLHNKNDFRNAWDQDRIKMRRRTNRSFSPLLLLIILFLIFIFLYIIDFDLTIFNNNLL
ncbi:MAG: hypothetical protein CMC67_01885 [Flavobacteriaceae bacterium]|nr:hypothetical protein [Flavobacteriaceae bacterium]